MKFSGLEREEHWSTDDQSSTSARQANKKCSAATQDPVKRKYWPGIQQDPSAEGLEPRNSTLAKISTTARPVNQGTAFGWSIESKNKHTFPTSWCLIWACIWTSHRTAELCFQSHILLVTPASGWDLLEPSLECKRFSGVQRSGFHSSS